MHNLDRKHYISQIQNNIGQNEMHFFFAPVFDSQGKPFLIEFTSPHHCKILDFNTLYLIEEKMISDLDYFMIKQSALYIKNYKTRYLFDEAMNKIQNDLCFRVRKNSYQFFLDKYENHLA